jgi:flagellar basal body-associated protein FliL
MAERATKVANAGEAESPAVVVPVAPKSFFPRISLQKWLLIVVGVSILLHGVGFTYYRLRQRPEPAPSAEVSLGNFHFQADKVERGATARADFSLHVALLEPVDPLARQRLAARKYHIQQDVEELLRKAHSGDFDDPGLQELKRQLHEQINQALGTRAVAEIIITDLKLQRSGQPSAAGLAEAETR